MNQKNHEAQVAKKLQVSKKNLRLYKDKVIKKLCDINLLNIIKDYKSNSHNNLMWHINNRCYYEVNKLNDEDRVKVFIKYYLLSHVLDKIRVAEEFNKNEAIYLLILEQLQFIYDVHGTFGVMISENEIHSTYKKAEVYGYFNNRLKNILIEYPNTRKFKFIKSVDIITAIFLDWYGNIDAIKTMDDLKVSIMKMDRLINDYILLSRNPEKQLSYEVTSSLQDYKFEIYGDDATSDIVGILITKSTLYIPEINNSLSPMLYENFYIKNNELSGILSVINNIDQSTFKEIRVKIKFDTIGYPENNNCPKYRLTFKFPFDLLKDPNYSNCTFHLNLITNLKYDICNNIESLDFVNLVKFKMEDLINFIKYC